MHISLNHHFSLYLRYGIKVGISCVLAYAASWLIGSPHAIWAVVSSIVATQINVAESLQAGILRLAGTVLGAAVGVALLLSLPQTPAVMAAAVFCLTTSYAYLTRYSNLFVAASLASAVVFFTGSPYLDAGSEGAISFGLMRVTEIAIGVGSALLVSLVLWPVRLVDTLRADLGLQCRESARLFDTILTAFVSGQQPLPYTLLKGIEDKIWDNHERLSKARKHESFLYHYEHRVMDVQVTALDRIAESLRTMLEALNDYDEEAQDPPITQELRALGDAVMATIRHIGGDTPANPAPDLVRGLTAGVGDVENKMIRLRREGVFSKYSLHKVLQVFAFYQGLRLLSESLLIALDRLQK